MRSGKNVFALYTTSVVGVLINSFVKSGIITGDEARALLDLAHKEISAANPDLTADFATVHQVFLSGVDRAERLRGAGGSDSSMGRPDLPFDA
jgi:hypothetical protein